MVEKLCRYVNPFSYNTSVLRTDRQTDRIAISISRVSSSMLTRDKNYMGDWGRQFEMLHYGIGKFQFLLESRVAVLWIEQMSITLGLYNVVNKTLFDILLMMCGAKVTLPLSYTVNTSRT